MFVEIIQIIIVVLSIYGAVTLKGKARAFLVAGTILCIGLYIYFFAVSGFAGMGRQKVPDVICCGCSLSRLRGHLRLLLENGYGVL